ncbi:PREDICTED: zinc finger CCCH-type antiviral protein 1-like [Elephantulus edwardii]|uniref:zinc finger CCCH-type antiviral protein 1-like n=1 Tax=Elephantulus edwardii TaxID=28737 RepID=UPI0003F0E0DE|nr:PREDICTED: zinc finger CCCH-type antiviral protein 1-like [Elephantulus edwardii]
MAEPTLCAFLTKVLCAHGGSMLLQDLRAHVELAEARLRAVLREAGPARFLLQDAAEPESLALAGAAAAPGGDDVACRVVAVSSARLCARYQRAECRACDQLHLCRRHMLGKCPHRDCWSTCTLSHDIHTPGNIQVLKNHGLFGLNEAQLRILLLQNDPSLLPEVCLLYNRGDALYGYCPLRDKCTKFHVCRSFVRGECKLPNCRRSHQLIQDAALKVVEDQGLSLGSTIHFQIIAAYKHMTLHRMLGSPGESLAGSPGGSLAGSPGDSLAEMRAEPSAMPGGDRANSGFWELVPASGAEPAKGPGKQGARGAVVAAASRPVSAPAAKEPGPGKPHRMSVK